MCVVLVSVCRLLVWLLRMSVMFDRLVLVVWVGRVRLFVSGVVVRVVRCCSVWWCVGVEVWGIGGVFLVICVWVVWLLGRLWNWFLVDKY